jgi:choline-sulfatase
MDRPNILYVMTDQQRFDTIAALGNPIIYTPNLDRLVRHGIAFTNAYSSCPVCVPARYNIRTGCEPPRAGVFSNGPFDLIPGQPEDIEERCGPFLARRLGQLGYRTFGIGKFHSSHRDLGYETFLRTEELFGSPEARANDAFASFIAREHPAFDFIEQLHGERTEMYYMPQTSPLPAEITYEAWAADRAIEQVARTDGRPWFGFVSFIGPHPPFAPPIPYNRLYDPDRMPDPLCGGREADHADEQIPWMNYFIWGDDISPACARCLKARYYGEITYIDACVGRILDAVEARPDAGNTLICFFTDHGDMLGDHHAWQKECFFEASCHVPFLLSWPARFAGEQRREELVSLTDLFALATGAAGSVETRDGIDVLGLLDGQVKPRDCYVGMYEVPGSPLFKCMVRWREWKYIFMANGGREQLFNLAEDPHELHNRVADRPEVAEELRACAVYSLSVPNADRALEHGRLKVFPFRPRPLQRVYQMDGSRGVRGFPEHPSKVLKSQEER